MNFELLTELKKYEPFDDVERKYVDETIEFLENGRNQFLRTNLERHVVAGAFLLNKKLDKILLTHHKALDRWLQFGGHSDGESDSLNVALREVNEESGINNVDIGCGKIFDVDIHTIPANSKKNEPEHKHIEIRFVFTTPEEKFVISDESDELAWFSLKDFYKMILVSCYSGDKRVIEKLSKYVSENKNK